MNNTHLDARTVRDIDQRIDRVHRDLGYAGGKILLPEVRELLRLDLQFYRLDEPGLLNEVVHKLKVGAQQVMARPGLLIDAVRKFDLSAIFVPDRKRILVDENVPDLKKRWCESHEIAHSLIPWHADYTLGDNRTTLSQGCHERIEAEANYGAGRLLFPNASFSEHRLSSTMTLEHVRSIAKHFGNTITSTLWRCVEQSDEIMFAIIGEHPHRPRQDKPQIEYFVRSRAFEAQFSNITEAEVWSWLQTYCRYNATGPLGATELRIQDANQDSHAFFIETFSIKHHALTLARWVRTSPVAVGGLLLSPL
ncbi:Peptidase-M78 domain-containing protein [Ralstonia mannitolilytica]|uniref:ImmA/IrrE family metallo-endopeptidase n=1 Tax=Ralstonia mannitolilytica TaxID=105219 RepID=UPI00197EE417|nr:ImmA/IrrE family metallo-endopeptidase [Ralstonia mannitolilytica]MBN6205374.1 ImmA/IrrE family metallo-endopeptidase [Ralstonia pickettii]CAJ0793726.1 hypothetical protein R77555_02531 [Ralstonia mannitolilytica]